MKLNRIAYKAINKVYRYVLDPFDSNLWSTKSSIMNRNRKVNKSVKQYIISKFFNLYSLITDESRFYWCYLNLDIVYMKLLKVSLWPSKTDFFNYLFGSNEPRRIYYKDEFTYINSTFIYENKVRLLIHRINLIVWENEHLL